MKNKADRKTRVVAALAGKPLDITRLRNSALATSIEGARQAAIRAGLRAIDGEHALALHRMRVERAGVADRLAEREPGHFAERWAWKKLAEAYHRADYRRATHAHQLLLDLCGNHASAMGGAEQRDSRRVGLPNSYAKKAYKVTASLHGITAPESWLRDVCLRGAALIDGRLVLELAREPGADGAYAVAWVEQGRGTSIRLERGHVTQREAQWAFARKRRVA